MKAVLQRVRNASVEVDGRVVSSIDAGMLVFLGVGKGDTDEAGRKLAAKVVDLRIFPDEKHSMNRSLKETGGEILLVSQFTLQADCRRGRRPSFVDAPFTPSSTRRILPVRKRCTRPSRKNFEPAESAPARGCLGLI